MIALTTFGLYAVVVAILIIVFFMALHRAKRAGGLLAERLRASDDPVDDALHRMVMGRPRK